MRRRCDRSFGLGPLFFFEGNGAGAGGSGDAGAGAGGDAGAGAGAGSGSPEDANKGAAGDGDKGDAGKGEGDKSDRSGTVPRSRFDEVNRELQRLRQAEADRQNAEDTAKGEHQKVAEREKAGREAAEARALTIARRSAFIGAAASNVADPEAAYKLATADGLLNDLEVDDDGNAKDPKAPGKIVEQVIAKYEFLKPEKGDRSFGGDRTGAGKGPELDPSKMTSREMLSAGFAQSSGRTRGS